MAPDENHGFLGQPADPVTGLNLLGARDYDPVIGRFLTSDPLFQAGDPNQMGGYTYAADNPASSSDPTGYDDWYNDPSMNKCAIDCDPKPSPSPAPPPTRTSSGSGGGSSAPQPSPGATPPATPPDPNVGPDLLYSSIEDIGLAIRSLAVCEFWLTGGGADHDQACQIAGGVYSGGMEGGGAGALERGAVGEGESGLVTTARAGSDADAAAAAGASAKAADEAASDVGDLTALKRANAQEQARAANAEAAEPSAPQAGAPGTRPSARDSRAPVQKTAPGRKASSAAVVTKTRVPRGTRIEDGLAGARNLRNRVAESTLFPNSDGVVASTGLAKKTWTAGYNAETGEIAVASSGCGFCAEGNVINALGGDANRVTLTRALYWDREMEVWDEMPICGDWDNR
ncbi:RHS repeat-associated core domain-containing protein [Streptomyces longwoodensis]|uniref:RHS repeat-associated core domain-containing protein n=1 Tax=Streptomyces longwoodensis TaxID=68231 RepID=UPI0033E19A61